MVITASLPKQLVDKLHAEKKETGLAMSEVIRRALDDYFRGRGK
jgi:metal-responsive CopG/Arc/MetJ family transcriptional regulator